MSLFVLSSRDGWVNIMYTGLDAVGVDQQVRMFNKYYSYMILSNITNVNIIFYIITADSELLRVALVIFHSVYFISRIFCTQYVCRCCGRKLS